MMPLPKHWRPTLLKAVRTLVQSRKSSPDVFVLALMAVLLMMTGCGSFAKREPLPANLVVACSPAPLFDGQTLADLMDYTIDLLGEYHLCKARMDAVVSANLGT